MQNTLNDSNALALQCICNCYTHIYTFFQKSITQSTDLFPGGSGEYLIFDKYHQGKCHIYTTTSFKVNIITDGERRAYIYIYIYIYGQ